MTARDEALLTFALFHDAPNKFRWAVTKAAICTVLHRHSGPCSADTLRREAAELLGVSQDSKLIEHALRNLRSEGLVSSDGSATEELRTRTRTTLTVAAAERQKLVDDCGTDLVPFLPMGTRGRESRAKRLAESVVDDLGHLVRSTVTERALRAAEPRASTREEEVARDRVRSLRDRLGAELSEDKAEDALRTLLARAAVDPFARRLAAAELFARLTEFDATELAQALGVPRLRVMLDASIAMPILCARYDRVSETWPASVEAGALHQALSERGATMILPAPYLEEVAAHLIKAGDYARAVGSDPALAHSKNYFVAHFCSTRDPEHQTESAFLELLSAFGASAPTRAEWRTRRVQAERAIRRILERYDIVVTDLDERGADRELPDEPPRPLVVLRHDRVVVSALTEAKAEPTILCTADVWLQGVCAAFEVTALDGAALADLLALVSPVGTDRPLVSPLALTFGNDQEVAAAEVWDAVVDVEGEGLDWKLVQRARAFRDDWLTRRRPEGPDARADSLREAWKAFRDEAD